MQSSAALIEIHKPHQLAFCFSRRPAYAGRDKGKREDEHRGEIHEVSTFRIKRSPRTGDSGAGGGATGFDLVVEATGLNPTHVVQHLGQLSTG